MTEHEANFPQTPEGVRDLSWAELRKMIEPDKETRTDRDPLNLANLEMARRVVNNCERVVDHYMRIMNQPLINQLNYKYKIKDAGSRLYIFLSEPFSNDINRTPKWHRVSLYDGFNKHTGEICRLRSYTSTIASRYFYREFKKELDELEIVYLEECLSNKLFVDSYTSADTDTPPIEVEAIRAAFPKLREVHQITIELLVVEELSSLQAFDVLKDYMNPRSKTLNGMTKEEYFASLTTVEKQNRVSLLKGQALDRLNILVQNELKRIKTNG